MIAAAALIARNRRVTEQRRQAQRNAARHNSRHRHNRN